ncbi:DNA polymerase III subunit [Peptacetobacter sp.]|uniref:DNA polymerase III subunit n=1 Tax=Peptacetobacter sp. TaxID=2991975 RepID=UPI00262676F8|nr:DNA polymerase III subunit delta' C-terminal domain-containing protein [Peptacetobacter sp.]
MYFEQIKEQDFAKRYISNAINKNMLNNAYIFEGINGIGKRTFAKLFAKILIGVSPENSPDFSIISKEDGSHRIKIEKIRKMKEDVYEKPISNYKIYMIENAELMSEEAQNAILKTIEEPPQYAIFILITENKEALLSTIKSRCDIVKFIPLSNETVKNYLIEELNLDEESAKVYATFSKGSINKAIELVNNEMFKEMREYIQDCIYTISEKNKLDIEMLADSSEKYENQIMNFFDIMINYFRDIILIKEGLEYNFLINADKITFIENMSEKINSSQITRIIDIIEDTKRKIKGFCGFKMSIQVMFLNIYEVIK